jgi:hypothetical protein
MGEVFEVPLGEDPSSEALGQLVGALGKKKTLRDNEVNARTWLTEYTGSPEAALELAADWLGRSGVQKALDRSLWVPEYSTPSDAVAVVTGAVPNWQDRAAALVAALRPREVFVAAGDQVMSTATELANPNVQAYQEGNNELPTQFQYAKNFVVPRLQRAGHEVSIIGYDTSDGAEIATKFVEQHENLLTGELVFARVANAGIQLTVQFRSAAKELSPEFDAYPDYPQAFVLTDTFPIARTEEQAGVANAKEFQNPFTGIRQIAVTAKSLVEAAA